MYPIFLIVGSPASGKSTVARALVKKYSRSVHIPVDDLRSMVVSGVKHPSATWTPELVEQLQLARQAALTMALGYQKADFVVIIDDFWDDHSQMLEYEPLWKTQSFIPVLLYPKQEQAKARNHGRLEPGTFRNYIDEGIDIVYKSLQAKIKDLELKGWRVLDTTDDTIEETVEKIRLKLS
jgi:adenylate kinase family enzyme